MAKKTKVEEPIKEMNNEAESEIVELTPEQLAAIQGGIQTVMNIGLAERLVLEDLQDRIFYLDGEVTEDVLHTLVTRIFKINGEEAYNADEESIRPIILIINSGGGSVLDGLAVCDAINASKVPVIGICVGYAYSMAFDIFTQCHYRIAMRNASFLYHDGYTCDSGTSSKVRDTAKFYEKVDNRINKMIANRTKLTTDYLESITRADTYWFADEGKENGFVDSIIGEDIELTDIFGFMSNTPCTCDECAED